MNINFQEKLERLAAKLKNDSIAYLRACSLACDTNVANCETKIVPGKKYTKIDIGYSGRYMVENETEKIFGIKGYGVVHKGHYYGTLDEIDNLFWGTYHAQRKAGV